VTPKTLTLGHVAFDTSGLFWKIAVRLDSPYHQQIAFIGKMHTNAIACCTSIRRLKRANYQLIDQLNLVSNNFFFKRANYQLIDQLNFVSNPPPKKKKYKGPDYRRTARILSR
jgi:hypothetical protein